jgi:hypothetical protein
MMMCVKTIACVLALCAPGHAAPITAKLGGVYRSEAWRVPPRQPQRYQPFQGPSMRFPAAVSERIPAGKKVFASPGDNQATDVANPSAAVVAGTTALNIYGEAIQRCEYKGRGPREECVYTEESPEICGFFTGISFVPERKDMCTSIWEFSNTKNTRFKTEGWGPGSFRIMCNALPSDVLEGQYTVDEWNNCAVFSKGYDLDAPKGFTGEKTYINEKISDRCKRFRKSVELICNYCEKQSTSASATNALNGKCEALKAMQEPAAPTAGVQASATSPNIFGAQIQDCAPAILRSQPNYAQLKAENSYDCKFTPDSTEICVESGDGTKCISVWDVEADGTQKSLFGFAGRLAAGINIECNALPSDLLQSQLTMDLLNMTNQLKWKSSFTGPQYDQRVTADSRRASKFREVIEQICQTCGGQATTENAKEILKNKCDSVLMAGGTTPNLIAEPESLTSQNISVGIIALTLFMLALIILKQLNIHRSGAYGLTERLLRA